MSKTLPDDVFGPQSGGGRGGGRDRKTTWPVSKGQFKYPVGVVLSISGEGVTVWGGGF